MLFSNITENFSVFKDTSFVYIMLCRCCYVPRGGLTVPRIVIMPCSRSTNTLSFLNYLFLLSALSFFCTPSPLPSLTASLPSSLSPLSPFLSDSLPLSPLLFSFSPTLSPFLPTSILLFLTLTLSFHFPFSLFLFLCSHHFLCRHHFLPPSSSLPHFVLSLSL